MDDILVSISSIIVPGANTYGNLELVTICALLTAGSRIDSAQLRTEIIY
jgi:hypothetical protein